MQNYVALDESDPSPAEVTFVLYDPINLGLNPLTPAPWKFQTELEVCAILSIEHRISIYELYECSDSFGLTDCSLILQDNSRRMLQTNPFSSYR